MPGFGAIHDLADVEIRVRRTLQTALHETNCARRMAQDFTSLDEEKLIALAEMLLKAEDAIKRVIGD